jgi:hypothetical protein
VNSPDRTFVHGAANGGFEPRLQDAAPRTNDRFRDNSKIAFKQTAQSGHSQKRSTLGRNFIEADIGQSAQHFDTPKANSDHKFGSTLPVFGSLLFLI